MSCFWTNLQLVTEDCTPSGDGTPAWVSLNGDGNSYGRFRVPYLQFGTQHPECLSGDLYDALLAASSVVITGLLLTGDDLSGADEEPLPAITFDDVSLAMTLFEFDTSAEYFFDNPIEVEDRLTQNTWYWARIEVDSVEYIGAMYMGGGV